MNFIPSLHYPFFGYYKLVFDICMWMVVVVDVVILLCYKIRSTNTLFWVPTHIVHKPCLEHFYTSVPIVKSFYLFVKQDMRETLIFYFFLVSILNTYLIFKYHLLVMNSLYYPLLLLNWYMFNIICKNKCLIILK